MAKIIDNFDYQGKKPNFSRDRFETLEEMHNYNPAWLSDGLITFCVEDRNHYKWDDAVGEWVLLQTGGAGGEINTEIADARYLSKTKDDSSAGVITAAGFKTEGDVDADMVNSSSIYAKDEIFSEGLIEGLFVESEDMHAEIGYIENLEADNGHIEYASSAYHTIIDEIRSEEFAEGLPGYGFKIDASGKAQMRSLELFESLIVPELRYNRVTVITGEQWQSSGGGVIESVNTNADEFRIRLEKGEGISLEVDDICKGIYHTENGFQTIYFSINDIVGISEDAEGNRHGVIGYTLREGYDIPPQANMTFVAYGNFTNAERQKSAYSTTSYKRYLVGVNDWEIKEENIAMQLGDLSGLVIGGKSFAGYSAYLSNIYMTGVIKQLSGNGKTYAIPAERGAWEEGETYYQNDRVSHDGCIWLCVVAETKTEPYEENADWLLEVSKGAQGISPNTSYKSTIFIRSEHTPALPSGGSYEQPVAAGWSDGVPDGDKQLWMSTRIFSSDGNAPQQAEWTTPKAITNTADIEVRYSSVENAPGTPDSASANWSEEAGSGTIWMAVRKSSNGVWGEWKVSKVKGERGEDGTSIKVKGSLASESMLPSPPSDPSDCYIIGLDLWVWDGDSWVNAGQFKGEKGEKGEDGISGSSAYLHIKYANSLTENDWTANNGETPGKYIGVYTDNKAEDLLDWGKYTWKKWTGEDGFGYEYIYCKTRTLSAPSVPTAQGNEDGYVPAGWSASPMSVSLNYPYCWMAYRQKSGGTWSAWKGSSDDVTLAALWAKYGADGATGATGPQGPKGDRGFQGSTGKDGRGIKSQTYTYQISGSDKEIPASGASVVDGVLRTSGSVESGVLLLIGQVKDGVLSVSDGDWLDKSPATTAEKPYLWRRTITVYTDGTSEATYALIGVKGDKGTDGLSVEYVFRSTYYNNAPSISGTSQDDDFVPTGWSDEPMNVSESAPYVWVSQRKKVNDVWGAFSTPTLWARFSKDGVNGKDGANGKNGENGLSVENIIEWYYLSTSATEMIGGVQTTARPQWQNGKYLWTRTQFNYSDGETTQYSDWRCVTGAAGEKGKAGKILRMRGEWSSKDSYVNNDEFQDVVIYSGNYYTPTIAKTNSTQHPTDANFWSPFNEFQNVATSVLIANQGYIDVLGSGEMFIGQTKDSDGWKITQGAIRHTVSKLTLTADGKLVAPSGTFEITTGQGELNQALSSLKVETNKISLNVSSAEGRISTLEQTAGSITTKVEDAEGNISSLQQTAQKLTLKVDSLESPISDNLLPNTDFTVVDTSKTNNYTPFDKWLLYGSASSVIEDADHLGKNAVYVNEASGYHGVRCTSTNFFGLSASEVFTISIYGKASSSSNAIQLVVRYLDASFTEITSERKSLGFYPSTSWVRKEATFSRSSSADAKYMMIDIYTNSAGRHWISMPKMERGAALTEWTPNVNDANNKKLLATGIDIENKNITVTTDTFKIQDNSGKEMAVFENVEQADGVLTPMLKTDLIRVKKLDAATGTFSGFIRHTPMIVDLATEEGRAKASEVFTHFEGINFDYLFPNFDKVGQYLILRNLTKANIKVWLGVSNSPDICYFFLPYKSADGKYSEFQLSGDYNINTEELEGVLGYSTPQDMSREAHSLVGESLRIVLDYDYRVVRDVVLQFVPLFYSSKVEDAYNFAFKFKPSSLIEYNGTVTEIDGSYYDYLVTTPYPSNGSANVPSDMKDYAMPYVSFECKTEVVLVDDVPCNHIYWETEVGYNITDRVVLEE